MPRKKLKVLAGRENAYVNCFAFRRTKSGKPECTALQDIYCIKEERPCPFRATPEQAAAAKERAYRRLHILGRCR